MKKHSLLLLCIVFLLCNDHRIYSHSLFSTFLGWTGTKEEVITHEQEVNPGAEIIINGIRGSIEIKTWNKRTILVEATKVGTIDELKLNKVEAVYSKKGAHLKTIQLKQDRPCTISYTLIVPKDAILKDIRSEKGKTSIKDVSTFTQAHVENGTVSLHNCSGSLQVSTKYGNITIHTEKVTPETKIFALAERGSIELKMPSKVDALFSAKTNKGRISSDCAITLEPKTMRISQASLSSFKRDIRGALGHGGTATINLITERGNVKVVEYA